MDYNRKYQKLFLINKRLGWAEPDPFGLNFGLRAALNQRFDPSFQAELEAEHKRLFPRRKKVNLLNVPEDFVDTLKKKYYKLAEAYVEKKVKQKLRVEAQLYKFAPFVKLEGVENRIVYTSDFGTYRSQGYGMERYTEADCLRIANIIRAKGIACDVKRSYHDKDYRVVTDVEGGKRIAYSHRTSSFEVSEKEQGLYQFGYCVIAPLTEYMLDAILRTTEQSLLDWAVSCWKTGTNPKVMNPFLPDDIYEESSRLARSRNDR